MTGLDSARRHLLADEDARVDVRRHWTVLVRPGAPAAGLFLLLSFLLLSTDGQGPVAGLLALGTLGTMAWLGWAVAEWRFDRFVVTNKRVLLVTGLLTRRVAMMPLVKVTDMTYERSWIGRIFGYGAFVMESAGQEQALHRVDHVPQPDDVAHAMFSLLFGAPAGAPLPTRTEPDPEPPAPRRDPPTDPSLVRLVPPPGDGSP